MTTVTNRLLWVDALKGFCIILVILGHMQIPELVRKFIFSFHMPIFFLISGYLAKHEGVSLKEMFVKRMNSLLVPYVIYSSIISVAWYFCGKSVPFGSIIRMDGIGVTWFLISIFLAETLGRIIQTASNGSVFKLVLFSVLLLVMSYYGKELKFFSLKSLFPATILWLIGNEVKKSQLLKICHGRNVLVCCLVPILCGCFFCFLNERVDMANGQYGNMVFFFLAAILISVSLLCLFYRLNIKASILVYFGRRSLLYMMWHTIVPMCILLIFARIGVDVNDNLLLKIGCRAINLIVVAVIVEILFRYAPWMSGQTKWFVR